MAALLSAVVDHGLNKPSTLLIAFVGYPTPMGGVLLNSAFLALWVCLATTRTSTTSRNSNSNSNNSNRLLYEHGYHAGNYADVVKHTILIQLLLEMSKKSKPFSYLETHSGAGKYPLDSSLGEYEHGIHSLLLNKDLNHDDLPLPTQTLLKLTQELSSKSYPGSPWISKSLCRPQDSLLFCENQPQQMKLLRENLLNDDDESSRNIEMVENNGYTALKQRESMTPSHRSLIFIDPPYQLGSDTEQICRLVNYWQRHWKSARVAIWHPVSTRNQKQSNRLYQLLRQSTKSDILAVEMYPKETNNRYVVGTGMALVNPPYGIDQELQRMLPELDRSLSASKAVPSTISIRFL